MRSDPIHERERTRLGIGRTPVFLIHPHAGGGHTAARLRRLLQSARFDDPQIVPIASYSDVRSAIARLERYRFPVAVGGDGTVALVASAVLAGGAVDTPLGIVPLGTANLLARNLGLGHPRLALRTLRDGTTRRIDVMRTSRPDAPLALVSISAGFEARFIRGYADHRSRSRGVAAMAAALRAGLRSVPIRLELDGRGFLEEDDRVFSAGLYNTRCYAGGLVMLPAADLEDGWCEAAAYRTPAGYAAALAAGLRNRRRLPPVHRSAPYQRPEVSRVRWRTAKLQCEGPLQIDGELFPGGELSVSVAAQALPVIVPAL